ncbi:hypothetical protein L1987_17483 [Smallanthus sonchifolius]|uniref:Uncharacterized protein n=1 Tax=Smallanthus sonchifolius TaxID=185202 RepID=A0ACB9IZ29_9ASTR|nr:hypothetical protein L1987_17483 [Smallanthus sonchifolius]
MIYHSHHRKQLRVCVKMEDIILLMLLCSSFCSFVQSYDTKDSDAGEPLDVILHEHAFKALLSQQRYKTGTVYEVKLPANLSGMDVSYIRFRSKTLWRKGANFSSFQIPSRTLPMPFVKRIVIMYQDLGNLSSQFYNNTIPGYLLVSSVVGFRVYDASNPTTTNARKIDFNTSDAPISVHFPDLKFPRGAKCASFGGSNGEFSLSDMSPGHVCYTRNYGRFSVVVPKRKKGGARVWWGVGAGFMTISFVGIMFVKIMNVKRLDEREMQMEEGSIDLETVWIGYSKMPCATITRTHPNLESPGLTT